MMNDRIRGIARVACISGVLALAAGLSSAHAQEEMPWEMGISPEKEALARSLYERAAELHGQLFFERARAKYQEALLHWDNPYIHLELARLAIRLGQPMSAYKHLNEVRRWGVAYLLEEERTRIREMERTLLTEQLATIEIRCNEPGADIAIDGVPMVVGPDGGRRVVAPEVHVITASKQGYFPVLESVAVLPGKSVKVTLRLSEDRIVKERRTADWQPWALLGVGVATIFVATEFRQRALGNQVRGGVALDTVCGGSPRCAPMQTAHHARAEWQGRTASGGFIIGGAALLTGLVWLNWPRTYRTENRSEVTMVSWPVVWEEGVGIATKITF